MLNDSWSPGVDYFSIATINLLILKRIRDSYFKNNFVIMKERQTHLKNFLAKLFLARNPCAIRSPFFFVRSLIIRFCFKTINFDKILFLILKKHNIFDLRKCLNYWSWIKSTFVQPFLFFYDIFFLRERENLKEN